MCPHVEHDAWNSCFAIMYLVLNPIIVPLGLSAGRMARAADRGKVVVAAPSRPWPVAFYVLAGPTAAGGHGAGDDAPGAAVAEATRGDGAGGDQATDTEAAPELTPCGGADRGAASGSGSGADAAPATPLETGPYNSIEWERQQMVRHRAGQDVDAALRPLMQGHADSQPLRLQVPCGGV